MLCVLVTTLKLLLNQALPFLAPLLSCQVMALPQFLSPLPSDVYLGPLMFNLTYPYHPTSESPAASRRPAKRRWSSNSSDSRASRPRSSTPDTPPEPPRHKPRETVKREPTPAGKAYRDRRGMAVQCCADSGRRSVLIQGAIC